MVEKGLREKRIGIISDTHGLLREEAVHALKGSDIIIHAGDIGSPGIIKELSRIARVAAVRGNVDRGEWAEELPVKQLIEFEGLHIYVIHDIKQIDIDPAASGAGIVIYGHSHKPVEKREEGIIYVNPGGAGPKRFNLPISVAAIKKTGSEIKVEFINLIK